MAAPTTTYPRGARLTRRGWSRLSVDERRDKFAALTRPEAEELFLVLRSQYQAELLEPLPLIERRSWLRLLHPDDVADVIQLFPIEERPALLDLLDEHTKREVVALLAYA